jgi:hypothetical protein
MVSNVVGMESVNDDLISLTLSGIIESELLVVNTDAHSHRRVPTAGVPDQPE